MNDAPTWMQEIRKNAGWLMVLGIIEIILGVIVIFSPLAGGLTVTMILGIAMMIGGIIRLFAAFGSDSFGAGALAFLWGLLVAAAGFYIATNPGLGLAALTLVLSMIFFINGLVQIVIAFQMKPVKGWGWMLTGGILGIILAILIWREFPVSGLWLVGTLVGISLLFNGLTTVMLGGAAREATAA